MKGEVLPRIPLNDGGEEKGDAIREERLPLLSGCLPCPESTGIQVDEIPGVITDTTISEVQGSIFQERKINLGYADINGFSLYMEAVSGHVSTLFYEQLVVFMGPESGYYMDIVISSQLLVHHIEEFNHVDIHICDLSCIMAPQDPVQGCERLLIIFAGCFSIGYFQPFICMNVIKRECSKGKFVGGKVFRKNRF